MDQVIAAVRTENQELPAGSLRSREAERVVQVDGRIKRPEDLQQIIVARRGASAGATAAAPGQAVRLSQLADVVDGPEEVESLALYNGQRTLALEVQKSQGENTIDVVDGLQRAVAALAPELPSGVALEVVRDNSRPIRVSVANVKRTLFEGALLTIAIVFLFLNSWRSTVITGLTLPIALIGTFLFMHAFGFSINMVTLMALSLCVGLLIDDAIVVRENIVRHVQMGKPAHDAALQGTDEIGLAVLATTLSIVAVFLPIGFMGGIIGKFFHEFGITIVAAVLISMFVSFTLDPMLSSIWHDPAIDREGKPFVPRSWYDHTLGRVTHAVDRLSHRLGDGYVATLALVAEAPHGHAGHRAGQPGGQLRDCTAAGHRVRAQGRLLRDLRQLLHAGGLVARGDRGTIAPGRRHPARDAGGALHADHHQHRAGAGPQLRQRVRAPGRSQGSHAQRGPDVGAAARTPGARCRASSSPMRACSTRWRAASRSRCRSRAPTWASCSASPAD